MGDRGTAVTLFLQNPLSPLLDAGYIENALRTHYQPLFDPRFDSVLRAVGLNARLLQTRARRCRDDRRRSAPGGACHHQREITTFLSV